MSMPLYPSGVRPVSVFVSSRAPRSRRGRITHAPVHRHGVSVVVAVVGCSAQRRWCVEPAAADFTKQGDTE